jgi:hypothetical protein
MGWLWHRMEPHIATTVEFCDSSKKIWELIEESFSNKKGVSWINRALNDLTQETLICVSWINWALNDLTQETLISQCSKWCGLQIIGIPDPFLTYSKYC